MAHRANNFYPCGGQQHEQCQCEGVGWGSGYGLYPQGQIYWCRFSKTVHMFQGMDFILLCLLHVLCHQKFISVKKKSNKLTSNFGHTIHVTYINS